MFMKNLLHHPYFLILMRTFGNVVMNPEQPEPKDLKLVIMDQLHLPVSTY